MSFLERVDQTIRRSPVWRSLFRQPYPRDERSRAYAVMNNVFLHIHPVRVRQHAVKFAYTFCLGGLSFFLFLVLTVTGVYLMFFYVPSATQAYTNILDIQSSVTFGLLTRNVHRWGAHLMVFFVFLHMMRVFYHGAYKPPREFNWVVGVVLLFLTIMLSFTGYLLPWDQIAYWAITIGTNSNSNNRLDTITKRFANPTDLGCSANGCIPANWTTAVWDTGGWNQMRVKFFGTGTGKVSVTRSRGSAS